MQNGPEYQQLQRIISACLNTISEERSGLRKTKSQIPATSELWFLETQLKGVNTIHEFLRWIKEEFYPQFEKHRSKSYPDANSHLTRIFYALALELVSQVKQSDLFEKENQEFISRLIETPLEEKSLECPPTPILRSPSCNQISEDQKNWSDTINQPSPK